MSAPDGDSGEENTKPSVIAAARCRHCIEAGADPVRLESRPIRGRIRSIALQGLVAGSGRKIFSLFGKGCGGLEGGCFQARKMGGGLSITWGAGSSRFPELRRPEMFAAMFAQHRQGLTRCLPQVGVLREAQFLRTTPIEHRRNNRQSLQR